MFTAERVYNQETSFNKKANFAGLDGTAFDINRQLDLLLQGQDLDTWINQTNEDLRYLYYEFLAKLKVIPFDMTTREGKLYCENYQKFFLDTISDQERNGATQFSVWQIHNYLMNSENGSMAAFVSPSGWAPPYGEYPDTQIYLYKKTSNESVEAVTLVTKMNLDECEDYLKVFGRGNNTIADTKNLRIEDVVLTPIFLNPDQAPDFKDFIYAVGAISDCDIDTLLNQFQNRDQLKQIKYTKIADLLEEFAEEVRENVDDINDSDQIQWLALYLKQTVLEMSAASRGVDDSVPRSEEFYEQEQQHFQKASREGPCPVTGVGNQQVIFGVGGARMVIGGKEILKCVTCPSCKSTVDAEIYEGKIHCPKCGASKILKS